MAATKEQREFLKKTFLMNDSDIDSIEDNMWKILNNFNVLAGYEIEAEAVTSSYCAAGIKTGDKFYFSAMPIMLNQEKSTARPCMRALGTITPFLNTISDRIVDGRDPNGSIWQVAECMDTGVGHGGFGKVRFKFRAVKK